MNRRVALVLLALIGFALLLLWLDKEPADQQPPAGVTTKASTTRSPTRRAWEAIAEESGEAIPVVTIRGQVKDAETKAPIADATVCVSGRPHEPWETGEREPACAKTTEHGAYSVATLPPGTYSVEASATGYQPRFYLDNDEHPLDLDPSQAREGVDIELVPGGVLTTGIVKDIGGGVVAGAQVEIYSDWSRGAGAHATSDDQGRFSATVLPGDVRVEASADGYVSGKASGTAPGQTLEVFLTPESGLHGRVEWQDGRPAAQARVYIGPGHVLFSVEMKDPRAIAGADGRFHIAPVEPGRYKPRATAPGGFGEARESVQVGVGEHSREIVIQLHPAFVVEGRVVTETGKGCERGEVSLTARGVDSTVTRVLERDGYARFDAMLPGTYTVEVECKEYAARSRYPHLEVSGDVLDVIWPVDAAATVSGRVLDQTDAPVVGAEVRPTSIEQRRYQDTTDDQGHFELTGLAPGHYALRASPEDAVPSDPVELEVTAGKTISDLVIHVDRGGIIRGHVRDACGEPVAGALVYPRNDSPFWKRVHTDDEGAYELRGVLPGPARVVARDAHYLEDFPEPDKPPDEPAGVPVTVRSGEVVRADLLVECRNKSIRGRVVTAEGTPVTDGFVAATREPTKAGKNKAWAQRRLRWRLEKPALTDLEGRFELNRLVPGNYFVRAFRKGGGEAMAEGVAAGSEITLTLLESGAIAGTVTAGGHAPERFEIWVLDAASGFERQESFFGTQGSFRVGGLPDGTYEVRADGREGNAQTTATVAGGRDTNDVRLELQPRATIAGRIFDVETGAPVAAMTTNAQVDDGAGLGFSSNVDPEQVTQEDGRFLIHDAPLGRVIVAAMPLGYPHSTYEYGSRPVTTKPGERLEVELPVAKQREGGGDLGYTLQQRDPTKSFADATLDVAIVQPNGPAAKAGLVVGDRIVAVNGIDVSGWRRYLYRPLARAPEGTPVRLTLARGVDVTITAGPRK